MTLPTVTVTGSFEDAEGSPATGLVTFRLNTPLLDTEGAVIVANTLISVPLTGGAFSQVLPATSGPDIEPASGVVYRVTEEIHGARTRRYRVELPHTDAAVDLSELAPIEETGLVWARAARGIEAVNAQDYGVVATTGTDTLVDMTSAMQTAGEAAIAAGKPLMLPAGNTYIAGALEFTGKLDIAGVFTSSAYKPVERAWSGGSALLAGTGTNSPVITLNGTSDADITGPYWRDFIILGSTNYNGGSSYAPRPAIKLRNVISQGRFDNIFVSGFTRQAWLLEGTQDCTWLTPRVYYCGTDGTYPAWDFQNSASVSHPNCNALRFIGGDTEKCPYALRVGGTARHLSFIGTKIEIGPGISPENSPVLVDTSAGEVSFTGGSQFTCNNSGDTGEYPGGIATAPYMFRIKNNLTRFDDAWFSVPTPTTGGDAAKGAKWIHHDGTGFHMDACTLDMPPAAFGVVVGANAHLGPRNWFRGHRTGGGSLNFLQVGADTRVDGGTFENRDGASAATGGTMISAAGANARVIRPKLKGSFGGSFAYIGGANAATCLYLPDVGVQTLGAAATDAASTQTLANNLRTALIALGLGTT